MSGESRRPARWGGLMREWVGWGLGFGAGWRGSGRRGVGRSTDGSCLEQGADGGALAEEQGPVLVGVVEDGVWGDAEGLVDGGDDVGGGDGVASGVGGEAVAGAVDGAAGDAAAG